MDLYTLQDWLNWINNQSSINEIKLGLERILPVATRVNVLTPSCPVIIVGGTNGKGSTVAGLEAIYRAAGYCTGTFTSPFLFKHNEEVCINGVPVSDEAFIHAFELIVSHKADIPLTPFEYHTLAALLILKAHTLDVWILEVGLGGRLDAVNILTADLAIITNVDLDHIAWLGDTVEKIAYEKAGIFRKNQLAIYGKNPPPKTLLERATQLQTKLYCYETDFTFVDEVSHWSFYSKQQSYTNLPKNNLALSNMANAVMGVTLLQNKLPVPLEAIHQGLTTVFLAGRIQLVNKDCLHLYDVSHNPAAIKNLAQCLKTLSCNGKTLAIFSMLHDKDIQSSLSAIADQIDIWFVAPLKTSRTYTLEQLKRIFEKMQLNVVFFDSIAHAYKEALKIITTEDRIIIFGSFHTVSEVILNSPIP